MKKNYSLNHALFGVLFIINVASAADTTSTTVITPEVSNKEGQNSKLLYAGVNLSLGITDHGDVNYRADIEIDLECLRKLKVVEDSNLPSWLRADRETTTLGYLQSKNSWAINWGSVSQYDIYGSFGFFDQGYLGYADANGSALLVSAKNGFYWRDTWWTKVHVQIDVGAELLGLWGGNGDARRELQGFNVVGGISLGF